MKIWQFIGLAWMACMTVSCDKESMNRTIGAVTPLLSGSKTVKGLTNGDIISGLKSALQVGSKNASSSLHKQNAYYGNPLLKILFPKEAQVVATTLNKIGMSSLVNKVVVSLNRAAEDAAIKAKPVFWSAISSMTIRDGLNILQGSNNAATQYLRKTAGIKLAQVFMPQIASSLRKVHATKYWADVMRYYNRVPFVKKINPNLTSYVTQKALNGLFSTVAKEETLIRKNPMKRVNSILRKVFGSLDRRR